MRTLHLDAGESPYRQGLQHGRAFAREIGRLAELRTRLAVEIGAFVSAKEVLAVAKMHLPVLERWDILLFQELMGIAEGSGVSPEHIVVLNHYTDLRDIDPEVVGVREAGHPQGGSVEAGGCTVLYGTVGGRPCLGQTWDTHASATEFVMMLHVPARGDVPASWVFTITGCLGMFGMNGDGVTVLVNNLRSDDAQVGVVWPALIRRCLLQNRAAEARDVVLAAPVGSGHHYFVADAQAAFAIETSGRLKEVVFESAGSQDAGFAHTNHCLDPAVGAHTSVAPTSTSVPRMSWAGASIAKSVPTDVRDIWARLAFRDGTKQSINQQLAPGASPDSFATCGAAAFDISNRKVLACQGPLDTEPALLVGFDEDVS